MSKIENYNVKPDSCQEKYCDTKATHFIEIKFLGIELVVQLCEKHHNLFFETYENNLIYMESEDGI